MTVQEIRKMDDNKLNETLEDLRRELFSLRFQHTTGQLDNPKRMGAVRKNIARVKTIQTERKLQGKEA